MLKVFLVDDSTYIRQRLARMFLPLQDIKIVGEATEAGEAMQAIHDLKPQLVILDIRLAGESSGIDVLRDVKQAASPPLVIEYLTGPTPPGSRPLIPTAFRRDTER